MFDRTLTERLEAATGDNPEPPKLFDRSVLLDSVLENMRRIFNERRGSCQTRPDYGMPDLNDIIGHGGTPAQLGMIVKEVMETFEPRLSDAIVRFQHDPINPLNINFQVSATLHYGEDSSRVSFDTILSEDKRIRVRG
jgi:type VI secretion system protein